MTKNSNKMTTSKKLIKYAIAVLALFINGLLSAQNSVPEQKVADLRILNISKGISIHIIAPEPIQFVDLSTDLLTGDLPSENIARVKIAEQTEKDSTVNTPILSKDDLGVITVVCQSFMAQYKVNYLPEKKYAVANIQIQPEDMQPLDYPKIAFSNIELGKFSLNVMKKDTAGKPIRTVQNLKMKMDLNNVYVFNDYIFLDMTFHNLSNLAYEMEGLSFSIEDKKIYKATNNQSIDNSPVFKLYDQKVFRKNFRNIYVFKKFNYPNSKVLKIRLVEEQLSGRSIEMSIRYSDILNADTF